jgi:hypothetical protein
MTGAEAWDRANADDHDHCVTGGYIRNMEKERENPL